MNTQDKLKLEGQRAKYLLVALGFIILLVTVPIWIFGILGITSWPFTGVIGYHLFKQFGLLMRSDPYPEQKKKSKPPD